MDGPNSSFSLHSLSPQIPFSSSFGWQRTTLNFKPVEYVISNSILEKNPRQQHLAYWALGSILPRVSMGLWDLKAVLSYSTWESWPHTLRVYVTWEQGPILSRESPWRENHVLIALGKSTGLENHDTILRESTWLESRDPYSPGSLRDVRTMSS